MAKKAVPEFDLMARMPPYPLSEIVTQMSALRRQGQDIIDLGMGNPDLPTADFVVDKLCEAAKKTKNHRYSVSRGIPKLRQAIATRYQKQYGVLLDSEKEVVVTMGAKEGFSHLMMAITQPGDVVLAPNPTYPIHYFAPVIARANVRDIRSDKLDQFFPAIEQAAKTIFPRPKILICSFPSNPTGHCVELSFFKDLVKFCRRHELCIVHDFAYADLCFDEYRAPSLLQVAGAKKIGVELYSLSKGYNMAGWRVAFAVGNEAMVGALKKIKSYLDYGTFQPIQIAATVALGQGDDVTDRTAEIYRTRRNALIDGLAKIGWVVPKPKATMFVWAKIPDAFAKQGSMAFSKMMLNEAGVCCAPGIGFGVYGEGFVRFALIENENRIRQAVRGIKGVLMSQGKC